MVLRPSTLVQRYFPIDIANHVAVSLLFPHWQFESIPKSHYGTPTREVRVGDRVRFVTSLEQAKRAYATMQGQLIPTLLKHPNHPSSWKHSVHHSTVHRYPQSVPWSSEVHSLSENCLFLPLVLGTYYTVVEVHHPGVFAVDTSSLKEMPFYHWNSVVDDKGRLLTYFPNGCIDSVLAVVPRPPARVWSQHPGMYLSTRVVVNGQSHFPTLVAAQAVAGRRNCSLLLMHCHVRVFGCAHSRGVYCGLTRS